MSMGTTSKGGIRVMQWNTLADGLAQHGDFLRVEAHHLAWESRSSRLLRTLEESNADLVCLQEVNRFEDFFLPRMSEMGYVGSFCPKPSSPCQRYGFPSDGCALFYRSECFAQVHPIECVCYGSLVKGSSQRQMMQLAHLKDLRSSKEIFVVSTHLKAKAGPENESLRREQVTELVKLLSNRVEERTIGKEGASGESGDVGIVVCGDFNDLPHSPVVHAMTSHPLGFRSAYPLNEGFTTWKFRTEGQKKAMIDYIWYAEGRGLVLEGITQLPGAEEIGENGLPSEKYPSDHLALVADFEWLH